MPLSGQQGNSYFFFTLTLCFKHNLMKGDAMDQYKIGKAVVRIHGTANEEKVKEAAETFLKKAERRAKKGDEDETEN